MRLDSFGRNAFFSAATHSVFHRAPPDRVIACLELLLPVSDAQATNERGWSAFDLLEDSEEWEIADFLAPFSFRPAVERGFFKAGAARMPRWAAHLESEALALEIASAATGAALGVAASSIAPGGERSEPRLSATRLASVLQTDQPDSAEKMADPRTPRRI